MASRKFDPKYDVAGGGARQPGSAWKPIVYATAFDNHALTPGSLLLDITTEFNRGENWAPRDADQLDRGPVLVRRALQYSLNIPAIRALQRVGSEAVADKAEALGIRFTGGREAFLQSGLAGAIGTVEVRPFDLTSAYGALANEGYRVPTRMVLEVHDPTGAIVYKAPGPTAPRTISAEAAYLVTDILAGNTDPKQNPIWSAALEIRNGPNGEHRPVAVKTGTANDARDLATYGYLAPPADPHGAGPRRRHLDGQQRSLDAELEQARDLTDGRSPALAGVRPRRDRGDAHRGLPATRRGDQRHDRRLVRRPTERLDPRHDQGVLHRRNPARSPPRSRYRRASLQPGVRRLAGRSAEGGARARRSGMPTSPIGSTGPGAALALGASTIAGRPTSGASGRGAAH